MARGHIFRNPKKKEEMLNLRIRGYSYERIAHKYKVDHTTIIYHCQVAGITLPLRVRNEMYAFIKQSVPAADIALKLTISVDVINRYIAIYGQYGNKVFSRRVIQTNPVPLGARPINIRKSKIKIQPVWWKVARKVRPLLLKIPQYVSMKEPIIIEQTPEAPKIITKIDKRGVEWMENGNGGWVCLGMSEEARRVDEERKRMKGLELKRLQMLSY